MLSLGSGSSIPAFRCATLTVPLDHGLVPGPHVSGQLRLQVAMADSSRPSRGVLVWLVGGPGEPGSRMAAEIAGQFDPAVLSQYRLVLISGRGTGDGALQCPALQRAVGASDLAVAPPAAVEACARVLGDNRRLYSTADTVADLDTLRQALGADTLTLDGASYGTLVAARYALTHPDRVSRLILDSVVPHDGIDLINLGVIARVPAVLRMVCQETRCVTDPAADLAAVVRAHRNGAELLDTIVGMSSGKLTLGELPAALHQAATGDPTALNAIAAASRAGAATPAEKLSQGLHASAVCQDTLAPWGNAASPLAARPAAAQAAAGALPDTTFYPFDRDTATGNGALLTCQQWPSTSVAAWTAGRSLPPVPVLVLAGDHDLITPPSFAQAEVDRAPRGQLVVIPGSGHITQDRVNGPAGRDAVTRFLLGS